MAKLKFKKGDQVQVISGKDKGKRGEILRALPSENKVVVAGVAVVKKAQKPTQANQQGGIVEKEAAIEASNVALIDPSTDKPCRCGFKVLEDGTKVRISRQTGTEIK